ncbi:MAG: sigma-70 family RNA polymerase sigma factor [Capsulimonas sp.]|uniref:sigma-70 family RNA polymerase sigma factor n=1 Tax=Capsulimonas sp. TaxID=2494211 RepID=UPI00326601D5
MTNEYTLARKAQGGDLEALTALVDGARLSLFGQAYGVLKHYDDAQDAVAAALLQICMHIGDLQDADRVNSWMQSIVRREALRLRRSPKTFDLRDEDQVSSPDDLMALLLRLDIARALRRLPGRQAQAVRLFYIDRMSIREIADTLGAASEGAVKVWLHRGRRQMAANMKGYDLMPETITASAPRMDHATAQPRRAAILQTHLAVDHLEAIKSALEVAGFIPDVLANTEFAELRIDDLPMRDALRRYDILVIDETLNDRSGLEYIEFCQAHLETANIPVTLLHAQEETALLTAACYSAGVTHLLRKDDPEAIAAAFRASEEVKAGDWSVFSEEVQGIVIQAQKEAIARNENLVSTEHLLLGAIHDQSGGVARLLTEQMDVSLEKISQDIQDGMRTGAALSEDQPLILAPRARNVLDSAQEEARAAGLRMVGAEHLLVGLLRENDGEAARALTAAGVTLERLRAAIVMPE